MGGEVVVTYSDRVDDRHVEAPSWVLDLRRRVEELLDGYRDTLRNCLDGLTEDEARSQLVSSNTTLLGLVKHVTYVEAVWFDQAIHGSAVSAVRRRWLAGRVVRSAGKRHDRFGARRPSAAVRDVS
jgi:Protein of unknown function (DUF664)